MKQYTVLITTSGIGSRLGELTKYTNKSLVRVGQKPIISYCIEAYPRNTNFIITLGYFGNHIREFLSLAYPNGKFTYINIDIYNGKGSSLGYSILKAKKYLQSPFIFHANDTIVEEFIPYPSENWCGGFRDTKSAQYSSFDVVGQVIKRMNPKGANTYDYLHIGLVGIYEYKSFLSNLEILHKNNPNDETLNDCKVIAEMLKQGSCFTAKEFKSWSDTGNIESLKRTQLKYGSDSTLLKKTNQSIFLLGKNVVKFHFDKNIISDRVKRAHVLRKVVPKITGHTDHFFKYSYILGETFSKIAYPSIFIKFLAWSYKYLWIKKQTIDKKLFQSLCFDFYFKKTKKRIQTFFEKNSLYDKEEIINDERIPKIQSILDSIDTDWLCDGYQSIIHGDLIPDNIIYKKNGFCLLDWRQNFGGQIEVGDIYYDFAKLNHNLIVNHKNVNSGLFSIEINGHRIKCDILCNHRLALCQEKLFKFVEKHSFDTMKVRLLTAIVWLNMSALHEHPIDLFLFYFGKYNLWLILQNQKKI